MIKVRQRLGSHEVFVALGSGGMGAVYRAHESKLNRDVVLKILSEALSSSNPSCRTNLDDELRRRLGDAR
jgi:serine/threonine protein kinase